MSDDDTLTGDAMEAMGRAHAPYSNFHVGAAVRAGGKVHRGANVENASYGLTLCAERNAIAAAVLDGARELEAIAVASEISPPAAPCGMCLQTMREFTTDPARLRVILVNGKGERHVYTLADLLPHGFGPGDLRRGG